MSNSITLSKVFRVFISSTFSDFVNERNYLQQYVFPQLENLCREHGALFQPIDLRWGITDEASMGQRTLEICLNEVRQCSEITPRPSFLILLGDRYGWIPIPVRVEQQKFESVYPTQLMKEWYRLDSNSGAYCLRPRTGDYTDRRRWREVEDQLRKDWAERGEAQISATHAEIKNGLDVPWENRESIFCFKRSLRDIPLTSEGAPFADFTKENGAYREDPVCVQKLRDLEAYISGLLPEENLISYEAAFSDKESLIQPFCEEIGRYLRDTILKELGRIETIDRQEAALTSENAFSSIVGANYVGQEQLLGRVLEHIASGEGITVVFGSEGKSAFSAALAARIKGRKVLLRHVGVSLLSGQAKSLAESILAQLGDDSSSEPGEQDLSTIAQRIRNRLEDEKTVLILDSVDRLTNASLLLKPLTGLRNVVVTASDRRTGDVLRAPHIEELFPLNSEERLKLFEDLLTAHGKRLSAEQKERMADVLANNEFAEFVRLCAEYAAQLHSWDKPLAAENEKDVAALIIDNLIHEQMHAPLLTKRMLTYIGMGRNGVTLPDLIALLVRDHEVFAEFNQGLYHPLCKEEIPVSVLSRLYYDLTPYLRHLPMMGADVISFSYGCFDDYILEEGPDEQALENAIAYYTEQADHDHIAALSELPYLLLHYRGTSELLRWFCQDEHLSRKFRKSLEAEVLTDSSLLDDIPEASCFKRILMNRFADFKRRPEVIQAVLQAETAVLHPGHGAEILGGMLDAIPFELQACSATRAVNPEIFLTGLLTWAFCTFNADGSKLLAAITNGTVTLYDLQNGTFTQSEMPRTNIDRFLYACAESNHTILALEQNHLMRLDAPDFWNIGLDQSSWSETGTTGAAEYLALSGDLPVTYGIKTASGEIELVQQTDEGDEHIPMDFLMRLSDINHIAVTQNGDIAVVFLSGAIAATTGLYDETTSGHALMCCAFYDHDTKIAAASAAGKLFFFKADGGLLGKLDLSIPNVMEQHIECMAYDRERELLYLGHRCGYLSVVSVADGFRLLGQLHSGMRMGILAIALSPDGSRLALGGRGNMNEAPLFVCDVQEIVRSVENTAQLSAGNSQTAAGHIPSAPQVFDKNISSARRAGDRWYYIYEHLGQADLPKELYSAPLDDPSGAAFITNASCYAVCARRGLLFYADPGSQNEHPLSVISDSTSYVCTTMSEMITGMAVNEGETCLAVSTQNHVYFYDLTTFKLTKKLFRGPSPEMKKTGSVELYSERTRFDAPMCFDSDSLLICCEKLFSFYDERSHQESETIRQLYVIDTATLEIEECINYQGFAHAVYREAGRIVIACGEGRLWMREQYHNGASGYFRSIAGAGVKRYNDGPMPQPDTIFDVSVSCVLKTPAMRLIATDEGDILCVRNDGEQIWFNIPSKPAAMTMENAQLLVLDDGAKNGGVPRQYRFNVT